MAQGRLTTIVGGGVLLAIGWGLWVGLPPVSSEIDMPAPVDSPQGRPLDSQASSLNSPVAPSATSTVRVPVVEPEPDVAAPPNSEQILVPLTKKDPHFRTLGACFREAGHALPDHINVPKSVAKQLSDLVREMRPAILVTEQAYSDAVLGAAAAKHAAGLSERYDPDATRLTRSEVARVIAPHDRYQATAAFVRDGVNYVARINPGEVAEVDSARASLADIRRRLLERALPLISPYIK